MGEPTANAFREGHFEAANFEGLMLDAGALEAALDRPRVGLEDALLEVLALQEPDHHPGMASLVWVGSGKGIAWARARRDGPEARGRFCGNRLSALALADRRPRTQVRRSGPAPASASLGDAAPASTPPWLLETDSVGVEPEESTSSAGSSWSGTARVGRIVSQCCPFAWWSPFPSHGGAVPAYPGTHPMAFHCPASRSC